MESRDLTASLRTLFPHADLSTASNPDGGWIVTMPSRSADELGVIDAPGAAGQTITRVAGTPLTVVGHRAVRQRDGGRMVAVHVKAAA